MFLVPLVFLYDFVKWAVGKLFCSVTNTCREGCDDGCRRIDFCSENDVVRCLCVNCLLIEKKIGVFGHSQNQEDKDLVPEYYCEETPILENSKFLKKQSINEYSDSDSTCSDDFDELDNTKNVQSKETTQLPNKNIVEHEEEKTENMPMMKLFTRSSIFVVLTLAMDYCCFRSLDLIPVSLSYIIFELESGISFAMSLLFFWSYVKKNLCVKVTLLVVILCGIVIIGFGKPSSSNRAYDNYVWGILLALFSVFATAFSDNFFLYLFGDLSLRRTVLFNGFIGINTFIVFIVVIPFLHVTKVEIINFQMILNYEIWMFLGICSIFQTVYCVGISLLLQYTSSPLLTCLLLLSLEVLISTLFDHFALGVSFSLLIWIGWVFVIIGTIAVNFAVLGPDLNIRERIWRRCKIIFGCSGKDEEESDLSDDESDESDESAVGYSDNDTGINLNREP